MYWFIYFFLVQDVRSEKGENESKLTENPGWVDFKAQ